MKIEHRRENMFGKYYTFNIYLPKNCDNEKIALNNELGH